MRVLLINPPRSPHNAIYDYAPPEAQRFIHRRLVGPPLGLLTVAAAVKEHEVAVLEMKGEYDLRPDAPPPAQLAREYLERVRPQVVGCTFIASEFPAGMEILRAVKAWSPEIVTVAGGLHATLCPEEFDDPAVDILCPGPSALVFRQIVQALESGAPLAGIGGIRLRTPEGLRTTAGPAAPCDPVDRDFLVPDRSHLKRWLPTYVVGKTSGPGTYLFTSLGCPYRCSFCSIWPQYGGRFMQRPVESIIAELKTLDDYIAVRFADANTLVDLAFAERLFDRIAAEGIQKIYIMDIRVDTAAENPALIEKLARAGLKVVITGLESFRQEELERYNKGLEAGLLERAIRVFEDNGVMMRGNYVIPPDYAEADFAALGEFAARHPTSLAGYTILTPMPGTPFHAEVRDRIIDHDLAKYNLFNSVLRTRLPLEEFYTRVGSLWQIRKGTRTL